LADITTYMHVCFRVRVWSKEALHRVVPVYPFCRASHRPTRSHGPACPVLQSLMATHRSILPSPRWPRVAFWPRRPYLAAEVQTANDFIIPWAVRCGCWDVYGKIRRSGQLQVSRLSWWQVIEWRGTRCG